MNVYESVYARKSVRNYTKDVISAKMIDGIFAFYQETEGLFGGIETELSVVDNRKKTAGWLAAASVHAPYYLLLYSEKKEKYMMNAGFIMQQLSLYLCSKGIGSCFVGSWLAKPGMKKKNGKELVCVLAFGKGKNGCTRRPIEANRLQTKEICVFKEKPRQWMNQLIEAARLAPSSLNSQPWRFVVYDNRIHVFSRKCKGEALSEKTELNFGVLFGSMMVVAEELWLDVDLIRLEGISQKVYAKGQYVLSVILRA